MNVDIIFFSSIFGEELAPIIYEVLAVLIYIIIPIALIVAILKIYSLNSKLNALIQMKDNSDNALFDILGEQMKQTQLLEKIERNLDYISRSNNNSVE